MLGLGGLVLVGVLGFEVGATAPASCLEHDTLVRLDGAWERALLDSDVELLESLLADDFRWVHNHASLVDSRDDVVGRASDLRARAEGSTSSRAQSEVSTLVLGSTGVVTGFTEVVRGGTATRYSFMRTYAEVDGRCLLLGNHTMALPDSG